MHEIICLNGVTAGYEGRAQITGMSMSVAERDFVGITGPNGSGKTTLLRVILGLLKPMSGSVEYYRGGHKVAHLRMGYLPQYNAIDHDFPISVYDTVLSGLCGTKPLWGRFKREHRDMADRAISAMGIDDISQRPIKALSGGQLQRVLLARAIVAKPEVLVLDEPDTYIDRQFKDQMHSLLAGINNDCAIVMVSHDREYIASAARHVITMNR